MKKLGRIKLNDCHEMSMMEMKKIVGGGTVVGVRFYNGHCYCDYQYDYPNGPVQCDQICEITWCEAAGIDTGLDNLPTTPDDLTPTTPPTTPTDPITTR